MQAYERRHWSRMSKKKKEEDPYTVVLMTQVILCVLALIIGYSLKENPPEGFEELRREYLELVTAEKAQIPSGMGEQLVIWGDQAHEMVSAWVSQALEKREQARQFIQPEPESTGEALSGQGGWMGSPKEEGKALPGSCQAAPIWMNVPVNPPVSGQVTSVYGYREHPITGSEDFHRGVDIAAAQGEEIRASLPGQVAEVGDSPIYGNYITLDHGNGLRTTYCHCERIIAQEGANLRQGELIATVGSTGISTGPHCHFEISKDGSYYNPAWVLRASL